MQSIRIKSGQLLLTIIGMLIVLNIAMTATSFAATIQQSGNQTVTAIVPGPPPTTQAIILAPQNNQTVTTTPLVVSGTCGGVNTVVKVFLNGDLAGITDCLGDGTFSLNIILGYGRKDLSAFVYDSLDQVGPNSTIITIYVTPLPISPTSPSTSSGGGTIVSRGRDNEPESNTASSESFQTKEGFFSKNPFKSLANVLGINSTSATSPVAEKAATVVAVTGVAVTTVVAVQFLLFWLINLDPTKTWVYQALVKIISK